MYSFLLGFLGADRIYLGYVGSGVIKLLLSLLPFLFCILISLAQPYHPEKRKIFKWSVIAFTGLVGFAAFAFWLVDVVLIAANGMDDANGFALKKTF